MGVNHGPFYCQEGDRAIELKCYRKFLRNNEPERLKKNADVLQDLSIGEHLYESEVAILWSCQTGRRGSDQLMLRWTWDIEDTMGMRLATSRVFLADLLCEEEYDSRNHYLNICFEFD